MARFEYLEPTSRQEAIGMLAQHGPAARPLAGGTDLLLRLRQGTLRPQYVVNLKRIPGLDQIRYDEVEGLRIGSLVTIRDVETSKVVRSRFPMLAQGAGMVGSVQVRNLATLAGNLCNASPAADTAPALLALGACLNIAGPGGERVVPLEEFFVGPGQTVLGPGELVVEVLVPNPPPASAGVYVKLSVRRAMDLAFVGVAALVVREPGGGRCREVRLALGAVAPTPVRVPEVESLLAGQHLTPDLLQQAGDLALGMAHPISDVRASAVYRQKMVKVLTQRALARAFELAKGVQQ